MSFPASSEAPYPLRVSPIFAAGLEDPSNLSSDILSISVNTVKNTRPRKGGLKPFFVETRSPYRMTKSALLAANLETEDSETKYGLLGLNESMGEDKASGFPDVFAQALGATFEPH